jgi:7-cyano-7-deazaguanine reductase
VPGDRPGPTSPIVIDYGWTAGCRVGPLKLYLAFFGNHGAFHEDCTVGIGSPAARAALPAHRRLPVPRGGMPIDVFWQTGTCPKSVWLPDQGVAPYRGRG